MEASLLSVLLMSWGNNGLFASLSAVALQSVAAVGGTDIMAAYASAQLTDWGYSLTGENSWRAPAAYPQKDSLSDSVGPLFAGAPSLSPSLLCCPPHFLNFILLRGDGKVIDHLLITPPSFTPSFFSPFSGYPLHFFWTFVATFQYFSELSYMAHWHKPVF